MQVKDFTLIFFYRILRIVYRSCKKTKIFKIFCLSENCPIGLSLTFPDTSGVSGSKGIRNCPGERF